MSFARDWKPKPSLSGSRAVREQSSDELLSKAKQERVARQVERQRQRSATTIACWWRGCRARGAMRQRLQQEWLQQYSGTVAQQQLAVPAVEFASSVLPPVLLAYLPATAQKRREVLLDGSALPPPLVADTRALRGCFALLLRSLAAADPQYNLLGLAIDTAEEQQEQHRLEERRPLLLSQLKRLLLLCCRLIGSTSTSKDVAASIDPLLQAAAGRLLGILCDASLWKCFSVQQGQRHAAQQWLQQQLLPWFAPLTLLEAAASRLVACLSKVPLEVGSSGSQPSPHHHNSNQQQQQLTTVLNGLISAQLKLWKQLQGQAADSIAGSTAARAAPQQLLQLLASPGLLPLLAPATVAQLTAVSSFSSLLESAATWKPAGSSGSAENQGQGVRGHDTLYLLGMLTQLAAGKKASQQQGRLVDFLPPSQLLQQEGVAAALGSAAVELLQPALEPGCHRRSSSTGSGSSALEPLWPFAEGTFAAQLLALLPLPQVAQLYHLLLLLADAGDGKASAARLLSALAFGTQLLPHLWRQLATSVGLPLEAPMQATQGWEVATLRHGIAGLSPEAATQLGLFCRVYCHQLMVVDDYEFHEKQQTFSLGQQRAIAAGLNTLIFRTQLPDSSGGTATAIRSSASLGRHYQMLQHSAPLLHRALYDRDARRRFCPPALWLEPYHQLVASGGQQQQPMSGAAVVRALLAAADDGVEEEENQAAQMPAAAARAAAAATAATSQPTAVAAILTAAPQCVPFDERLAVFRALIDTNKERNGYNLAPVDGGARPLPITIRRGYVLEDAATQLARLGGGVKCRLNITFINQLGHQEAGIDMGGLMKEFLESAVAAGFDPNRGLFGSTPDGYVYPHPLAERLDGGLAALETMGLLLGRALYEGVLLDLPLAPFFVSRLQGRWPLFEELQALDPEVYRSLLQLKRYEGHVADLDLDFTVESDFLGSTVSEELVPGGSHIAVTNENVLQYVYLVADWHLNKRLGSTATAFSRGLSRVIPASWLRLFSPREVNQLLGGGEAAGLDVDDMKTHTQYSNGYSTASNAIKHFWRVVRGMSNEEQHGLLKFVTSCSRAPLGGFQHLNPPLTIHKVDCSASLLAAVGGKDVERLPTASTCSNTLKLPNFRRIATLRDKLLYAIRAGAGFELS